MGITTNDAIQALREQGRTFTKIPTGYYVGRGEPGSGQGFYILCMCEGDGLLIQHACECGTQNFCCQDCVENGLITHCQRCRGVYKKRMRQFAKATGLSVEDAEAKFLEMARMLNTPIDFDQLVADGMFERISANKYKLLVPLSEIPEYVGVQVKSVSSNKIIGDGKVVESEIFWEF